MSRISHQPAHPGWKIRNEVIPALAITEAELARRMCVSVALLTSLLSGRTALNVEMAVKVSRISGIGVDVWLRMQAAYDLGPHGTATWTETQDECLQRGAA